MHKVRVEVRLCRVDATVEDGVAAAPAPAAPLAPHPALIVAHEALRQLVHVHAPTQHLSEPAHLGRQLLDLSEGRAVAELAPVRGQLGTPVAEPECARAVGAKPARMAAAPAVHALAVPRAVVEAVVAAHVLAG